MNEGIKIPYEVADQVTLACLLEQHKMLKQNIEDHLERGAYMHPEDLGNAGRYVHALEILIPYFGGVVND